MVEFLEQMELTLYFMRLEDKYWGLFLLGVFVLFYLGKKETKGLLRLTLVTACVCLCPLTAYGLTLLFPSLKDYYHLWHMVPAGVVVCAALTILSKEWCESRRRTAAFLLGVFVILYFAGEFAYTSADAWNDDASFLGKEEAGVYEMILEDMDKEKKTDAALWGPYKIMADSRVYSFSLSPIYGKDIASGSTVYSDSLVSLYQGYSTYEAVEGPAENMEEQVMAIANCLNVFPEVSCDYVVMINPAAKVADWGEVSKENAKKADTVNETDAANEQALIDKVRNIDTIWIFEELGYEYVGETESLLVFRRL